MGVGHPLGRFSLGHLTHLSIATRLTGFSSFMFVFAMASFVCVCLLRVLFYPLLVSDCQCNRLFGKTRLRNDLFCVQ